MKWIEVLRNGRYALLQNEKDTQFVFAVGYDPNGNEDEQWASGTYFTYWTPKRKAYYLEKAVDFFRMRTEPDYIPRGRLEELATKFKDRIAEDAIEFGDSDEDFVYFFECECEMMWYELDFFGIPRIEKEEEDDEW